MVIIFSGLFNVEIPAGWISEENSDLLTIYCKENSVGVLQISAYTISNKVKFDIEEELLEYVSDRSQIEKSDLKKHITPDKISSYIAIIHDATFWRYQMIFSKGTLLLITYNCEPSDLNLEKEKINEIINSISFIKTK